MPDTGAQTETKVPRTAKGKKPQYFQDPAIDKLLAMVLTLTQELSVTRDRVDTLERLIEKHGLFKRDEIETYDIPEDVMAERSKNRSAYIARVLKVVQDELDSLSAKGPGENMPEPPDDK